MFRPRHSPVWLAALAMLLHLLAMPLMGADLSGIPAHCQITGPGLQGAEQARSGHAGVDHAATGGQTEPAHGKHLAMPCCCAGGHAVLASTAVDAGGLHEPRRIALERLAPAVVPHIPPRHRWPSLNPRASPFA